MRKYPVVVAAFSLLVLGALFFLSALLPPAGADAKMAPVVFEVKQGEGFRRVTGDLEAAGLVRSSVAAATFALASGSAFHFRPGLYRLNSSMSVPAIVAELSAGQQEAAVTIPEGANSYQIDEMLANALVIHPGDLVAFRRSVGAAGDVEGKLFPDTYQFFTGSDVASVVGKLTGNFNAKAGPLLAQAGKNSRKDLVLASILEKEVPDPADQAIVAGILLKRLATGMALQVDATVCYAKLQMAFAAGPLGSLPSCYPLSPLDFHIDSPYNTYLYKGLPPGPIGNPGISAISAVLRPKSSPYWFYLSDPKTGKTIFAKTLDEQATNKVKYLKGY